MAGPLRRSGGRTVRSPGVGRLGRRESRETWTQEWDTVRKFPWPAPVLFMSEGVS